MSYQPPTGSNDPTYQTPQEQPYTQYPQTPYPPPQYTPPPPPRKRRTWLWIVLGIGIFLVLICAGLVALAAIGSRSTTTTTPASTAASGNTPSEGNTPAPAPNVSKVGGTITVNNVAVTLISVKPLAGDQFTQPKPGSEFIVVHVKIVNNSTNEVDYNVFDFHVRSGTGNITDEEIGVPSTYTANNELNSGKLSAGGNVEGDIIFQVKKGDHKAQMTWQPNFLGNAGDNAWDLGL